MTTQIQLTPMTSKSLDIDQQKNLKGLLVPLDLTVGTLIIHVLSPGVEVQISCMLRDCNKFVLTSYSSLTFGSSRFHQFVCCVEQRFPLSVSDQPGFFSIVSGRQYDPNPVTHILYSSHTMVKVFFLHPRAHKHARVHNFTILIFMPALQHV